MPIVWLDTRYEARKPIRVAEDAIQTANGGGRTTVTHIDALPLDLGVTLFDTAPNYGCGHSERLLGQALSSRRGHAVIATKFGQTIDEAARVVTGIDLTDAGIRRSCEASLRRLRSDSIGLFQCHVGRLEAAQVDSMGETLEALSDEGKIRGYGWSTHDAEGLRRLAAGGRCTAVEHVLNVLERPEAVRSSSMTPIGFDTVADPYRWLEEIESEEVLAWVKSENDRAGTARGSALAGGCRKRSTKRASPTRL